MSTVTKSDLLAAMLYWQRRHDDYLPGLVHLRLTDYPPQSLRAVARWLTQITTGVYGCTDRVDPDWTREHIDGIARRLRALAVALETAEQGPTSPIGPAV